MTPNIATRKLRAILSADAKDYSRLMRSDELATVRTLTRYRSMITELVSKYQGRVVDSPGDNLLAEFASVVHAVQCGFEIQDSLQTENAKLSEDRRMEFRIGINLGDVIQEGERIYGDGVNVAARMESLAEPGGICVSSSAYDQIEHKFAFGCEYIGEQTVKNISTPIRAYRLARDETGQGCTINPQVQKSSHRLLYAVVFGLLILSVGSFLAWNIYQHQATASIESASMDQMALPLPDKPSIVVLPFKNISGDEKDGLIARGLTEDIITTLSRVPELFVIASASSFAYEGKKVKVSQVSEELGVRYVLDGSLQRSKDRLRFNVQLVDAVAGNQIWADRFNRPVRDLFALQDDIVRRILVELQVRLIEGEHARIYSRKAKNLDAWLLFAQANHEGYKFTRAGMSRARELYEAARKIDPNWAQPLEGLSWTYWYEARMGWTEDREEWMRKGIELAEKAVEWAPEEPGGYKALGNLALSKRDYDQAIAYREKALKLAPNDFSCLWGLGGVLYKAGEPERAIGILKKAMRLNPSKMVALLWTMADAQVVAGQYEDAIITSNEAAAHQPESMYPHIFLAAAYSAVGRLEEARTEAARLLEINPKFTVSAWMKSRLLKDPADTEKYASLLLKAGLPENTK
jgi:adenylate cyclase